MKLVTVQFNDSVDISVLAKGTTGISVTDGTNTLENGIIRILSDVSEPEPEIVQHTHPAAIGPATPT